MRINAYSTRLGKSSYPFYTVPEAAIEFALLVSMVKLHCFIRLHNSTFMLKCPAFTHAPCISSNVQESRILPQIYAVILNRGPIGISAHEK